MAPKKSSSSARKQATKQPKQSPRSRQSPQAQARRRDGNTDGGSIE